MCAQENHPDLKQIFAAAKLSVKWSCGRRYVDVGSFVGSKAMERKCVEVEEKVEGWVSGVGALA